MVEINLVILICDSLRYDYAHLLDLDYDYGTRIIRSWTPATGTDDGWATIFSGLPPSEHRIGLGGKRLSTRTIFDLFPNCELYCPTSFGDPCVNKIEDTPRYIFNFNPHVDPKSLADMDKPFCWVEPVMHTQLLRRHKQVHEGEDNVTWVHATRVSDYKYRYLVSLGEAKSHINWRIKQINLSNTQVLVTSDHGELMPEEFDDVEPKKGADGITSKWVHGVDHPKVHEVPFIPIPDINWVPDEISQTDIYEVVRELVEGANNKHKNYE